MQFSKKNLGLLIWFFIFYTVVYAMDESTFEAEMHEFYNFVEKLNTLTTKERQGVRNYVVYSTNTTDPYDCCYEVEKVATFNNKLSVLSLRSEYVEYQLPYAVCIGALLEAIKLNSDYRRYEPGQEFNQALAHVEKQFELRLRLADRASAMRASKNRPNHCQQTPWCWLF